MLKKRFPLFLGVIFFMFIALFFFLGSLQVQASTTAIASLAQFEIVATDLVNPRGLVFGPDGALFISEAGAGGDGVCIPGPDGEQCYGTSGAVTKVTFDSKGKPDLQEQIVTGLSSLGQKDSGNNAIGPNDIAFTKAGDLYVLMGLGADPALRDPGGPLGTAGINFGQLVAVDDEGNWSNEVDIAFFEAVNNPDGAQVDSNPYALLAQDNVFKVVDAGGNTLLNVAMTNDAMALAAATDITAEAVFPTQIVEFPPGSGQKVSVEAVPTAVEVGPDGAYYVSELTGFPFPVGGASIYRVVANEDPEVYLSGFTNIVDMAWGPDGSLFVLEMAKDGLLVDPPAGGQIVQVTPYGARSVFASEGLITPVDMEVGPDHALYVINFGPSATKGEVVRVSLPSSTKTISPSKDNTLYESESGLLSNGSGQHFFAGVTSGRTGNLLRRGLLAFDVAAALPNGATVLSATLELNMSRSISDGKLVSLHRAIKDWGEGSSDADREEGGGAPAETGDATWLHTFSNTGTWDAAGGDYDTPDSASTVVHGAGKYSWSSTQMASDVQDWLEGTADNFGWLLRGDESGAATAKRFDSRENPEEAKRPILTVRYVKPLPDYAAFAPLIRAAD